MRKTKKAKTGLLVSTEKVRTLTPDKLSNVVGGFQCSNNSCWISCGMTGGQCPNTSCHYSNPD